ncbi:type IV secretory system conjugative DNA transfer family protein [Terricaulis sp.]|uniref:type IV secretory system conjugative DNA transfer family protein n=1 Tax=Terricaulis sp. TaxID=2768686 RepID=UPI002ADDA080|nr:type IV secretory system conjugative DNA transfer family protein [Terricaulis sp.]
MARARTPRSRKKPQEAAGQGLRPEVMDLLLGWKADGDGRDPIGFGAPRAAEEAIQGEVPILYGEDRHLLTIAPTGAGKGRGVIIPNLLRFEGSVIVIDPKGETWHVTHRRRKEMGQEVRLLDPFGAVSKRTDSLNPFDLFDRPGALLDADAEMLASLLAGDVGFHKEPFWDNWGRSLMAGVIAAVAETAPKGERHFGKVREILMSDDAVYNLAALIEGHENLNRLSKQNISSFLPITEQTRSGILSTAQSYLKVVNSDSALRSLSKSTISLDSVRKGDPMTIYIVIPPDKLESHGALLRLWVGALMLTVMGRKRRPKRSTLFLLDECAQLGEFGPLRQSMTLLRGYGLQVWPFFQDLSQLQRLYPKDWRTIFNNAGVFQLFGVANHLMAKESSELIGDVNADTLRAMTKAQQIIAASNEKAMSARLPDYLLDAPFQGQFDANPMFEPDSPSPAAKRRPPRAR